MQLNVLHASFGFVFRDTMFDATDTTQDHNQNDWVELQ